MSPQILSKTTLDMHATKWCRMIVPTNIRSSKEFRLTSNNIRSHLNINGKTVRAKPISFPSNGNHTQEVNDEEVAMWDYQFLFTSQRLEVEDPIRLNLTDGTFPQNIPSGTYYLIGPGLFADDFGSMIHPLDGPGYVRAFEIDGPNREVRFFAKYVKTKAHVEECDPISGTWSFSHRGPFSVLKGGKMIANIKVMKNVANTSILQWGGRLFSLWEGGTPYEIHPKTLDTIGNFDLIDKNDGLEFHDGPSNTGYKFHAWKFVARLLRPILCGLFKMSPKRVLSHYKIDARRGRLLIMTCNAEDMVLPISHCIFYEFDTHFNLLHKRAFDISDHLMIHDWAFTDSHYILFGNRIKLDISGTMAAICGLAPMISALSVNHDKPTSSIYLLPRFSNTNSNFCSDEYWTKPIEIPQLWLLHFANAFEYIDNHGNLMIRIQASACAYKWFNFPKMFGYNWKSDILDPSTMNCGDEKGSSLPHLIEVSIKLHKRGNLPEFYITQLSKCNGSSDFPIINPLYSGYRHRYVYAAASSGSCRTLPHFPFNTIVKIDTISKTTHTWSPGIRRFVGEPMFISTQPNAEDDGYLLVVEYVGSHKRCNLLILDSKRIGETNCLVARFEVPKHLTFPLGFHGTWTPK